MLWCIISIFLIGFYSLLLLLYKYWYAKLTIVQPLSVFQPSVKFTILIPARNEEKNITACLQSMEYLNYPSDLFEILVIDDFSDDGSAETYHFRKNQFV